MNQDNTWGLTHATSTAIQLTSRQLYDHHRGIRDEADPSSYGWSRIAFLYEPEDESVNSTAYLKELTGGDILRDPYFKNDFNQK